MSLDAPSVEPDAIDTLIQRCLAGDQAAWEQIVRTFRRRVFNIAYKFTGRHDLAEDLTQDVFVKIFKSLDTFDRRANFQTWLVSVSRNLCIDHYRSVRKEREAIDRDVDPGDLAPVSPTTSPYAALEATDRASLLRRGLKELAPSLREAVVMRDLQELSYQEIADNLGLPEGTVKSRINRGRNELARQISRIRDSDDRAVAARTTGGGPDPPPERSGRMNFTIERSKDVAIVRLDEARLMYPLLADFAGAVTGLLDAGDRKVLLDFAKVTYVDSATIGCLMDLYRQATAKGGSLKLATVQKRVETMLTMTGAHNFLALHADEATALASFGA